MFSLNEALTSFYSSCSVKLTKPGLNGEISYNAEQKTPNTEMFGMNSLLIPVFTVGLPGVREDVLKLVLIHLCITHILFAHFQNCIQYKSITL